jgi:hypothetical protein
VIVDLPEKSTVGGKNWQCFLHFHLEDDIGWFEKTSSKVKNGARKEY